FFQAEDGIRDKLVTGVQTCALPIFLVAISFPSAAPARIPPLASVPAAKHGSVDGAVFAVLEHAFAPIRVGRIDPERFDLPGVGINAKDLVAHLERAILARE